MALKFLKCVSSLRIEFAGMNWLTAAICSILLATRVDCGKMGEAQNAKGTTCATSTFLSVSSSAQPPPLPGTISFHSLHRLKLCLTKQTTKPINPSANHSTLYPQNSPPTNISLPRLPLFPGLLLRFHTFPSSPSGWNFLPHRTRRFRYATAAP
jgi:hypothetical protein